MTVIAVVEGAPTSAKYHCQHTAPPLISLNLTLDACFCFAPINTEAVQALCINLSSFIMGQSRRRPLGCQSPNLLVTSFAADMEAQDCLSLD